MPYADPQKRREHVREYQRTPAGKAATLRANRAYRQRRKDRLRAHNAVAKAIARGKMQPWPACALPECSDKPEAHHPDYGAPLTVTWLCSAHHKAAHALTRLLQKETP